MSWHARRLLAIIQPDIKSLRQVTAYKQFINLPKGDATTCGHDGSSAQLTLQAFYSRVNHENYH